MLHESQTLQEIRVGLHPDLLALLYIECVRLVGQGDDKRSDLTRTEAEGTLDAAAQFLFHRRVSGVAIHAYQGLGKSLDEGQNCDTSALALSIEGLRYVLANGFSQEAGGEVPKMVMMALKLA